jgi:hypothetical protein
VATAAEDRLNFHGRNSHKCLLFAAASDCRAIAIYEYTPWENLVEQHDRVFKLECSALTDY